MLADGALVNSRGTTVSSHFTIHDAWCNDNGRLAVDDAPRNQWDVVYKTKVLYAALPNIYSISPETGNGLC
jgi:hypothetical protein